MVQVPPGVAPGMTFHANIGGRLVGVTVPPGIGPGSTLQIQVPVAPVQHAPQQYQPAQQLGQQQQHRQQQYQPPRAPLQKQPTMSMNDEMALKQKQEDAQKAVQKLREERAKEANSALAQMDKKSEQRELHAHGGAPQPMAAYGGRGQFGGASAKPGEVSALWWLGMGL